MCVRACVCVCVGACVCSCLSACMRVTVHACVRAWVYRACLSLACMRECVRGYVIVFMHVCV